MLHKDIIKSMEQAIHIEAKMGYIDTAVMGGFSAFIIKSAKKLLEVVEKEEIKEEVDLILQIFKGYVEQNRTDRKEMVQRGIGVLGQLSSKLSLINAEPNRISHSKDTEMGENIKDHEGQSAIKIKTKPKAIVEPKANNKLSGNKSLRISSWNTEREKSIQYIKNIGPKRARLLNKMGIYNVHDLIYHIPRRYEDRSQLKPFHHLINGEVETVKGTAVGVQDIKPRPRLTITKVALRDGQSVGYAVWFNQPFIKRQLRLGAEVIVTGKVDRKYGSVQISVSDFEIVESKEIVHSGRIVPVYPVTEGLPQRVIRTIIKNLLDNYLPEVQETLPVDIKQRFGFMNIQEALNNIHFPEKLEMIEEARRRLVFDEFFILQLGLILMKGNQQEKTKGIVHKKSGPLMERFMVRLPFPLTEAQQRVLNDIFEDMESSRSMNRLLQGDVGSGKTIVSAAALIKSVESGYQGVLMAPTEILAEQHYIGLQELFTPLGVTVSLLTGSISKKEKQAVLEDIAEGRTDIVIGTHAIIQEGVEFQKLGLAITDEQHRFGVKQRAKLKEKGQSPDVLVMTATPIPRTMSMTVYGDLDVSVIDQLPPGRQPIKTFWVTENKRDQMYDFIRQQVKEGRQAYMVCPLVEESDKLEVEAAVEMADRLSKSVFMDLNIGLLHGRMKAAEKEEVMTAFRKGDIDILVATTVIEVGVNVPNATIMVIEDAERFGLAQLHQLRGRVGRGEHQSFCILVANPKTEEGRSRMNIMQSSSDGFVIAEEDLKLRGPGDFFGTRQSGLPEFKVADLLRDTKILELARKVAYEVVAEDPNLSLPEHSFIKEAVLESFKDKYKFIDIS